MGVITGLPPNFYQVSTLKSLTLIMGTFLKRDNTMYCVTRPKGARFCVEMDVLKPPVQSFWIGHPAGEKRHCQEIIYENLQLFVPLVGRAL